MQIHRQPTGTGRNEPDVFPLGAARMDRVRDRRVAAGIRRVQTGPADVHPIVLSSTAR